MKRKEKKKETKIEGRDPRCGRDICQKKKKKRKGWILEVKLGYPKMFHDSYNAYSLAPKKNSVEKEWMLDYQIGLLDNLGQKFTGEKFMLKESCVPLQKPATVLLSRNKAQKGPSSYHIRAGVLDMS